MILTLSVYLAYVVLTRGGGEIEMAQQKLSTTVVEVIAPASTDVIVWDTTLPGFGVRIKPTGVRSYVIQYRNWTTGASKRLTIGQHGPLLTFDQAKRQARGILADAMRGQDLSEERRAKRDAPTLSDLATDYLDKYATPKKRPKSVRGDRALLANIIIQRFGTQKVAAIAARDIEALHAFMRDRPYQANRVLALLSKMFNLAIQWGWRGDNPVKGIRRMKRRGATGGSRMRSYVDSAENWTST